METVTSVMHSVEASLRKALCTTSDIIDLENLTESNINSLKKTQVKEILKSLGLPRTGNVADLKKRLLDYVTRKNEEDEVARVPNILSPKDGDLKDETPDVKSNKKTPTLKGKKEEAEESEEVCAVATIDNQNSSIKTGTTSADRSNNKKKKWGISDPTQIAPNCYHRDLFVVNFPLVKVVDVPPGLSFSVRDKFEGNSLDPEATTEAKKRWIRRYFEVEHIYGMAENEQQAFPHHFAFMESVLQFTMPSRQDLQIHKERCGNLKRKWSYEEIQTERKKRKFDADDEHNAGLRIVPDIEEVQGPLGANRSDGDNQGMEITTEETVKMTGNLQEDSDAVTGFADGVVHVMDYRPLERGDCTSIHDLNPDRVVAIIERKFAEDLHKWNARFQGGFYAVKHCMVNLQRGHGTPVYVLIFTSSLWSYGILVPEGYVQIRDGKIDVKCMREFKSHQTMTGASKVGLEELQEKLMEGTKLYRKKFRANPHAHYHDGPMLVGTYYLSPRWFSLPKAEPSNGKLAAVCRLFEGLIRLVIGDSAIDMKAEDFEWRWQMRECMLKEQIDVWSN